jgi:hypothetical protein
VHGGVESGTSFGRFDDQTAPATAPVYRYADPVATFVRLSRRVFSDGYLPSAETAADHADGATNAVAATIGGSVIAPKHTTTGTQRRHGTLPSVEHSDEDPRGRLTHLSRVPTKSAVGGRRAATHSGAEPSGEYDEAFAGILIGEARTSDGGALCTDSTGLAIPGFETFTVSVPSGACSPTAPVPYFR